MMLMVMFFMIVMVMMLMNRFLCQLFEQLLLQGFITFHRFEDRVAGQLIPWCCDDPGVRIVAAQQCYVGFQFFFTDILCPAEDDRFGVRNLVNIEFTEIFGVHFAFFGVRDRDKGREFTRHIL